MSEIMRATGINVASCHAVLSALTERGYLQRKGKSYILGSALVAVGDAASQTHSLVGRAKEAVEDLNHRLGVAAQLSTIAGNDILSLYSLPDRQGRFAGLKAGQRVPLVPPNGAHFIAWAAEEDIADWLARSDQAGDALTKHWRHELALTRSRGYQVTLRTAQTDAFAQLMANMAAGVRSSSAEDIDQSRIADQGWELNQPEEILADQEYEAVLIAAPIFDAEGKAVLSLQLGGFAGSLTGARIQELAQTLMESCVEIMRYDREYQAAAGR